MTSAAADVGVADVGKVLKPSLVQRSWASRAENAEKAKQMRSQSPLHKRAAHSLGGAALLACGSCMSTYQPGFSRSGYWCVRVCDWRKQRAGRQREFSMTTKGANSPVHRQQQEDRDSSAHRQQQEDCWRWDFVSGDGRNAAPSVEGYDDAIRGELNEVSSWGVTKPQKQSTCQHHQDQLQHPKIWGDDGSSRRLPVVPLPVGYQP
jgi:hypothetical protein